MANREIGEVKLVGKGATYTLRFGSYAIAQLETELNMTMLGIAEELEKPERRRMKTLGTALWAALSEHHPTIEVRDAFKIMDDVGFEVAGEALVDAMNAAFPEAEADAGNGAAPPNRRTRRATAAKGRGKAA